MYARARKSYQDTYLETASPARLLDDLFARLLRDIRDATVCLDAGDLGGKGVAIGHAHAIVTELQAALDYAVAPDLCRQLARLYEFVLDCLTTANRKADKGPLVNAERVAKTLYTAFQGATGAPAPR